MDGAAVEEELLGERGLAGVGVQMIANVRRRPWRPRSEAAGALRLGWEMVVKLSSSPVPGMYGASTGIYAKEWEMHPISRIHQIKQQLEKQQLQFFGASGRKTISQRLILKEVSFEISAAGRLNSNTRKRN